MRPARLVLMITPSVGRFEFECEQCGAKRLIDLNVRDVQRWQKGALIQRVFPQLDSDTRELMMSGTCGPCFDKMYPPE